MAREEASRASPLINGLVAVQMQCPDFFGVFEYPNIIRDPIGQTRVFNHNVLFDLVSYNDTSIYLSVSAFFHQFLLPSFVLPIRDDGCDVDFPISSCMMDLCVTALHHDGLLSLKDLYLRTFRYHTTGTVAFRVIRWIGSECGSTIDQNGKNLVIDF